MDVSECPPNALPVQPMVNMLVLGHVNRVVEINESMAKRLTEYRPRYREQQGANREFQK